MPSDGESYEGIFHFDRCADRFQMSLSRQSQSIQRQPTCSSMSRQIYHAALDEEIEVIRLHSQLDVLRKRS